MGKKWFYFENYVCLNMLSPDKVLLYNTLNHVVLTYKNENIYTFIRKLNSVENNGVVEFDLAIESQDLCDFILEVKANFMGDLLSFSDDENERKPILFKSDILILNEGHMYYDYGKNILHNITEMTFYINGLCMADCEFCNLYYKQFLCCHKENNSEELKLESIVSCLESLQESSLLRVNIIGGNIFSYSDFYLLVDKLNLFSFKKIYKVNLKQIVEISDLYYIMNHSNNMLELICTDLSDLNKIPLIFKELKFENLLINILVQSLDDLERIDKFFDADCFNLLLSPFYNGENIDFFKNNIFVCRDELNTVSLSDIKCNYILNNHFFGSFVCLPNGAIYSGLNDACLGNILHDTMASITFEELNTTNCWLQVRRNVVPCKNCLYSCLCPPISNYEKAIGYNNLCSII